MVIRILSCFSLILLLKVSAFAQLDTIEYQLGYLNTFANQHYLPHWITANRFGVFNDGEYYAGLLRGDIKSTYKITKEFSFDAGIDAIAKYPFIKGQSQSVFFQQAYLSAKYSVFKLTGGRKERTLGTHAEGLSTGSLALSGNARPVPMILLEVPEYSPVPFTKGYIKFKGTYAHQWLEEDRLVKNPYLHEKSFYLKFGGDLKINFSAGLVHYVVWGGETDRYGKLPQDFGNYMNLVLGKSAEDVDLTNPNLIGEVANAVGDHFGVYDFALYAKLKSIDVTVYHQTPFEDWTGTRLFRNKDRLLGINFKSKAFKWIESVAYEYLYTLYQSGPGRPGGAGKQAPELYGYHYGGRDNYYNNYLYKTGWVYHNRIMGTPLFYTKARMRLYDSDFVDPDGKKFNFNVVNNRVVAHHVGLQGELSKSIRYKLLSTFTRNYGTYGGINGGITRWGSIENPDLEYAFKPAKNQNYFLLEIESHPFSKSWSLLTAIAWDTGALYHNFGTLIGLRRKGIVRTKNMLK